MMVVGLNLVISVTCILRLEHHRPFFFTCLTNHHIVMYFMNENVNAKKK